MTSLTAILSTVTASFLASLVEVEGTVKSARGSHHDLDFGNEIWNRDPWSSRASYL